MSERGRVTVAPTHTRIALARLGIKIACNVAASPSATPMCSRLPSSRLNSHDKKYARFALKQIPTSNGMQASAELTIVSAKETRRTFKSTNITVRCGWGQNMLNRQQINWSKVYCAWLCVARCSWPQHGRILLL